MKRPKDRQMPYLPSDDCRRDSNPGGSGLGAYGDEASHGSAAHSPAFEKWLNNYRKQLDKVLRGERGEEISEHEVLFPRESRSEQAPGGM